MAIKLPDPGNGIPEQKTGNDEWTNMKIVRDNFADQSNAASRLVGTAEGNLKPVTSFAYSGSTELKSDAWKLKTADIVNMSNEGAWGYPKGVFIESGFNSGFLLFHSPYATNNANANLRVVLLNNLSEGGEVTLKTGFALIQNINAFADSNGFWKTSSPVVRVYANEIDPNDDAEKQGVTFTRNGVGDYTLHNTLGLAQTGWQLELPEDNNRNPLIAIETKYLENGDLNIRTYKRIFSMQTFTFGCDYDNPMDIPESRCIDVRLHEIKDEPNEV